MVSVAWSAALEAEDQAAEAEAAETDLDWAEAVDPDPGCLER